MEIRDLEYLLASANAGNFGRAAKALGLSTSTLSRRIGKLEDELGLAVFERGRSGAHPTIGGKAVLQRARRVLAEFDALKQSGGQGGAGDGGEIRLGLRLPLVGDPLVSLLANWHASHPRATLIVSELNERDLATGIEERALDVAVLPSHFVWPHTASIPLYRERLLTAIPATHRFPVTRSRSEFRRAGLDTLRKSPPSSRSSPPMKPATSRAPPTPSMAEEPQVDHCHSAAMRNRRTRNAPPQ